MNFLRLTILILSCLFLAKAYGQRYEIGGSGVATGYMGDLNRVNPFYYKNFGGGIFIKYNLDPLWGIKFSANHLRLSADDLDFENGLQQKRNLKFNNQLTEMSLTAEFNFWTYSVRKRIKWNPYISTGLAILNHDPFINYEGEKIKLRPLMLEYDNTTNGKLYSNWNIAIPLIVGIKYKLNSSWAIGAEVNYRLAFTDYLDNVSKYYPTSLPIDLSGLNVMIGPKDAKRPFDSSDWAYLADPSNNLAMNTGSARGDGKNRDGYMTAGITVTYTIFDPNCYSWIKR